MTNTVLETILTDAEVKLHPQKRAAMKQRG